MLWDALRKTIEISAQLCQAHGLSDWRENAYNLRKVKKLFRHAQKLKHSTSKDEDFLVVGDFHPLLLAGLYRRTTRQSNFFL